MSLLISIAFCGFIAGGFIIFKITLFDFIRSLSCIVYKKDKSIKARIVAVNKNKNKNTKGIRLLLKETRNILEAVNKLERFPAICTISFAMMVAGAFFAISISNMLLVPVLAVGCGLLPFWYVLFTAVFYRKQLNSELETALSVITSSYLRTESIIIAVEENVSYLNPPVADVFKSFSNQTRLINSNIKHGIELLKGKIDNDVFREWCDVLIACQDNRNLKSTLLPVVSKLSDIRAVTSEMDYLLYEPVKEFATMAILLIGNIPMLYFLNRNWFNILMFHTAGKIVLAITGVVVFVSLAAVIRLSKPVEYKR